MPLTDTAIHNAKPGTKPIKFINNRVFVSSAYVRGQLKDTKTKSGKREVILQP